MTWIVDALNIGKKEKEEKIYKLEETVSQQKAAEEKKEAASKYAEDYTQQVFDQHFGQIMRELSDHGYQITKELSPLNMDGNDVRKKIGRFFPAGFRFVHEFDYDVNGGPNSHAETQPNYRKGGSSLRITIHEDSPYLYLRLTFAPILSNPHNADVPVLLGFIMAFDEYLHGDFYFIGLNTSVENIKVALKKFLAEEIRAQVSK